MNWFKKYSQTQFGLFSGEKEKSLDERTEKKNPDIHIWGLKPSGVLSVVIDGRLYEYENVIPDEERQLQTLLNHKNYRKFFSILREITERKQPFKRTLPYAK